MNKTKNTHRLIWLVTTIRKSRRITLKELRDAFKEQVETLLINAKKTA